MRESARDRLTFAESAPFDAGMQFRLVYALWFLGRIDEADRAAARGLEMWPRTRVSGSPACGCAPVAAGWNGRWSRLPTRPRVHRCPSR